MTLRTRSQQLRDLLDRRAGWLLLAGAAVRRGRNRTVLLRRRDADVVVDGFPRSGNTFVAVWVTLAWPAVTVASHVHAGSHVRRAAALDVPAVVMIREPLDAVASLLHYMDSDDVRGQLRRYIGFHTQIQALREESPQALAILSFSALKSPTLIADSISRLPQWGHGPPQHLPQEEQVFERVDALARQRHGATSLDRRTSRPVDGRRRRGVQDLQELLSFDQKGRDLLCEARTLHARLHEAATS